VADKLTQLIADALARAAAEPAGLPLFASRTEAGLFPATSAAKPAAKRCLDDGLVATVQVPANGRPAREVCRLTDKGTRFLAEHASPKQVLEDFVRVLEARQADADHLIAAARHLAESVAGLKATVLAVAGAPQSRVEGSELKSSELGTRNSELGTEEPDAAILAHLAGWSAAAGAGPDCPLPDLYRGVAAAGLTIGRFHDRLRALHAAGRLYLHPWTGPLYAVPEPTFALLVGHNIAYYASSRKG
jgi:hypothetical protein